ncbi:MAG: pseudoazurin [Bacteriovoracaceae bacterium]
MYKLIFILVLSSLSIVGNAKEYKVEMLNKSNGESMVFKPMFLKAEVGDIITFIPTTKGHTSESVYTPKGANTWKGKTSKEVKVTLNKDGVYIYKCKNHGVMGMTGLIQVGKPVNLIESKEFYNEFKKKFVMNKDRLDKFLNTISD